MRFDRDYYQRFYHPSGTPVHTREQVAKLAQAVDSLCGWWGLNVRSVLDVGAGPGYWRDWYRSERPKVKVVSTDVSDYACEKYGHLKKDIARWKPARSFDLVICHGVLHYLSDRDAAAAIRNLAACTRDVLYLEAITTGDVEKVIDRDATDLAFQPRSREWYSSRLARHFRQAGAGLWIRKKGSVLLYELEGSPS